jgi:8-oxo-dGTP pyrophosphatase MutT (NUDIX family)
VSDLFPNLPDDPDAVPVRPAATVMLLRDGVDGLEVCLMQRNLQSDFVGGAYVFPGGGLDPDDATAEIYERCAGRTDADASLLLDLPDGGLAYWVAAVRESFEEAGVLLAVDAAGAPVAFDDAEVRTRFEQHRRTVDAGERSLLDVLRDEDLAVDVTALHYFSRWITPLGAPRRYDTRFFVAAAPEWQEVSHDDRELIGTYWMSPQEALDRSAAGEFTLIFPTIRSLVALTRFDDSAAVLDHAAGLAEVPAVLPTIRESPDGLRIVLPGDPDHPGGMYDAMTGRPVES